MSLLGMYNFVANFSHLASFQELRATFQKQKALNTLLSCLIALESVP